MLLTIACGSHPQSKSSPPPAEQTPAPQAQAVPETETRVEMVNVKIRLDPSLILHIRHLRGRFVPTKKGQPPTFDDKLSYTVDIDSAVVAVSMGSMTHAMNAYIFGQPDAPMKDLELSAEGTQIKQKGKLRK